MKTFKLKSISMKSFRLKSTFYSKLGQKPGECLSTLVSPLALLPPHSQPPAKYQQFDNFRKINVIDLFYGPGADGSPPLPPHPPQGKWQAAAFAAPDKIDLFNSASHVYVFGWIFK